jgi:putative component of toxin-antitoxin plasmid stabilization module
VDTSLIGGTRIDNPGGSLEAMILLCGGDKRTQQKDIKRAQKLAETW